MPDLASTLPTAAVSDWRKVLGADRVYCSTEIPQHHRSDTASGGHAPAAVLKVERADQIPALLQVARQHRTPVHPISTGNNWGYGSSLPNQPAAVVLDLSELTGIIHFDPALGVVTVEPGVTQGALAAFLESGGHDFMVPVTGAGPTCSVLANALERGYGITPHVDHFAAVTDIEAVLADGTVYKSALHEAGTEELARLFKWGIGPYLNGLFTQSGFGIVTRMTIALARRPACTKICLFNLADDRLLERATERIRELLQELPGILGGVNLMNRHRVLAMTAPYPAPSSLDEDGLMPEDMVNALGKAYQIAPWTGFATLYGTQDVVKAAQRHIRQKLRGTATRLLFLSPSNVDWIAKAAGALPGEIGRRLQRTANTLRASMQLVRGRPNETALPITYWRSRLEQPKSGHNPAHDGCGLFWYAPLVPMRPDSVRKFVNFATATLRHHKLEPLITLTSQGDRLFDSTIPLLFDRKDPSASDSAREALETLITSGRSLGFYPYRLHIQSQEAHGQRQATSAQLAKRLRRALDPDDLLAPGRYDTAPTRTPSDG
ncbi:FAD-binding oxidoreductase [Roseateles sp. BYS87W]